MKLLRQATYLAVLTALSHAASADDARQQFKIDIASQPLDEALLEFSRQASVQVILQSAAGRNLTAPSVTGSFTWEAALSKLLSNTDLRYEFLNERTVAIVSTQADRASLNLQDDQWNRFLLAQSDASSSSVYPSNEAVKAGQPANEGRGEVDRLEEVIVSAQRREEVLQDVPISISVLDGDKLDSSNAVSLLEELQRVPGVTVTTNALSGGATTLQVRGVGSTNGLYSGASPIGYYLDGVPFGFIRSALVPDTDAYDLDRVEVLRGPQGTLYGVNSLNGVVRVLTKDADLENVDLKARISQSRTQGGDPSSRGDFAVNVPLIDDALGMRIVGTENRIGGWISNLGETDANDSRHRSLRLKINAEPTDQLSAEFMAWFSRRDDDGGNAANTDDDRRTFTVAEPQSSDVDAYSLGLSYDFGAITASSTTSHMTFLSDGVFAFFDPFELFISVDSEVFAQEFSLDSDDEGPWDWSLGAIYRQVDDATAQTAFYIPSGRLDITDSSESAAVFGQVTRKLFDDHLRISAGLRYFHDEVTQEQRNVNNTGTNTSVTSTFNATTPRIVATWLPNDDFTAYVSYSQGFRSGLNQSGTLQLVAPGFPPADPDRLANYEIGAKGVAAGGLLNYEAALYYIEWEDIQTLLTIPNPFSSFGNIVALVNGDGASGLGFDAAVSVAPASGLNVGLSFSYNDVAYDSDVLSDYTGDGVLDVVNREGQRIDGTADYTGSAFVTYNFPLAENVDMALNASANYLTETHSGGSTIFFADYGKQVIYRGSATLGFKDRWKLSLFGENLGNERTSVTPDSSLRISLRPRTVGLQLAYGY